MTLLLVATHAVLWLVLIGNVAYLRRSNSRRVAAASGRLVSVLIPARNEGENLSALLPELLHQSYDNLEIIVFDDDSSDNTEAVVAEHLDDDRLIYLRGLGPPEGWVGKVAALYQAARTASGQIYLFLDADVRLLTEDAIESLVRDFEGCPSDSVVTTAPGLSGAGSLLVSLVPFTIFSALPWFLIRSTRSRSIAALNGQAWVIAANDYHRLEPHEHVRDRVLEDVEIGRYLKSRGIYPTLVHARDLLSVRMYDSFADAWRGFRKNAYLIMGGHPLPFVAYWLLFALATWLSPVVSFHFLLSAWIIKLVADRLSGTPLSVSLLAPVSFMLATFLQIDSALSHWSGRVAWKGRNVAGG